MECNQEVIVDPDRRAPRRGEGGFELFGTGAFWNGAGMDAKRADKAGSIPPSILADLYVTTQQYAEARWMRACVL